MESTRSNDIAELPMNYCDGCGWPVTHCRCAVSEFDWNAIMIHIDGEITEEERYQAFKARLEREKDESGKCPKCGCRAVFIGSMKCYSLRTR